MTRGAGHLTAEERLRAEQADQASKLGAAGLPWLMDHLADRSWAVRRRVIAALADMGAPAVKALCGSLRDERDDETRIAAVVDALAASRADVTREMLEMSAEPSSALVADAIQVLGRRRARAAIPRLVELLAGDDDNVGVGAIEALGRIGGGAAVDSLIGVATSGNFFRTFPAIDVLGRTGDPRATPVLAALLADPRYALEAARALGRGGDRASAKPLANLLSHPSNSTVRVAAVALADLAVTHETHYGDSGMMRAALGVAVPPGAIRRLAACIEGAATAEKIAICHVLSMFGTDAAVSPLASMLDDEPAVARAAAEALHAMGKTADAELLAALREGDSAKRAVVLPQIAARRTALEDVLRCLQDPDGSVRALACDVLARIGDPVAVPAIFALLEDPNARVTQASTAAIQALGSEVTETLALQAAESKDNRVRRQALRIIGYFGYRSALRLVVASAGAADAQIRDAAISALPFIDDAAARAALLELSSDVDEHARASAIRALGHLEASEPVLTRLVSALADPDRWVRYYACRSLGKLRHEGATRQVAELLADPAGQVRVGAIEALSHFANDDAFRALAEAAQSSQLDVQRAAILALGLAHRPDATAVLLDASRSADASTRLVLVSALSAFDGEEVVRALGRLAADPDEGVRSAAFGILAERPSREATDELLVLLTADPTSVRIRQALALPSPGRVESIAAAIIDADEELAPVLSSALARMRTPDALAALLATLVGGGSVARRAAAITLGAAFGSEASVALRRASEEDPDADVRRVSAIALGA